MAEQDETGIVFFVAGGFFPAYVQPIQDQFVGLCSSSIFKQLHPHTIDVGCLNLMGDLHLGMAEVVGMDEPSHETNHQYGCGVGLARDGGRAFGAGAGGSEEHKTASEDLNGHEEQGKKHL